MISKAVDKEILKKAREEAFNSTVRMRNELTLIMMEQSPLGMFIDEDGKAELLYSKADQAIRDLYIRNINKAMSEVYKSYGLMP